jgi:hypothetical protein
MGSLLLAAVLAAPPAEAAADERFLREARVESMKAVGEGIAGAQRVVLRRGEATARAVFKTIDTRTDGPYAFGTETVAHYRDTYRHELAAHALDRLLGFGLVPATVERKIGGKTGSLQAWVERALPRFAAAAPPADARRADEQVHAMRLFDYLVFKTDRHVRNVVFGPDWRVAAIDNSIAFHAFVRPFRPLYRFPRGPVAKLRALDARTLDGALRRWLEKDERAAVRTRRQTALAAVDAALAREGERALFDW